MAWGECDTDESGNVIAQPLSNASGGSDVDITKWGARRINLTISDVQQSIQEGIGNITPFNISGGNFQGDSIQS